MPGESSESTLRQRKLPAYPSYSRPKNHRNSRALSGVSVTAAEADAILQQLADKDKDNKKTWSRVFVERYLLDVCFFSCTVFYIPYFGYSGILMTIFFLLLLSDRKIGTFHRRPNRPDLKKAWAYYEHVTLPRHFIGDRSADTILRKAEPGEHEEETELYDPFWTPQKAFVEWGSGIDLYFISLMCFAMFMFVAACMVSAIVRNEEKIS